jgi:hypothetical protein
MRALKIDVTKREITEIEIPDKKPLSQMQAVVGGLITIAVTLPNDDDVFVDDEGLLKGPPGFFVIKGGHQPFAGNGLVCGSDPATGETVAAKTSLEEMRGLVRFPWPRGL